VNLANSKQRYDNCLIPTFYSLLGYYFLPPPTKILASSGIPRGLFFLASAPKLSKSTNNYTIFWRECPVVEGGFLEIGYYDTSECLGAAPSVSGGEKNFVPPSRTKVNDHPHLWCLLENLGLLIGLLPSNPLLPVGTTFAY